MVDDDGLMIYTYTAHLCLPFSLVLFAVSAFSLRSHLRLIHSLSALIMFPLSPSFSSLCPSYLLIGGPVRDVHPHPG
ncbi:hypothetical protein HETIRDRAFT_434919 [Heterobasidion irregulare TC 32-1]|uniref:Uncharacterized protein n=1 Tax=Heterobasidion irregulare (strain TC 32-1) TaxID=747525 RepID=W4K5T0_HETIT|nr:uncharacterized protein HETIRDRAFT_434919 [Heterobasidion irregulare TC 32-1]ETW81124.1 hypothetical protein HETIRDRAFT_434919 [Heterobasidion irregulare TC 32-1]